MGGLGFEFWQRQTQKHLQMKGTFLIMSVSAYIYIYIYIYGLSSNSQGLKFVWWWGMVPMKELVKKGRGSGKT